MSPSGEPHVTVPRGRSARSGIAVVHRGVLPPVDRATVGGLRTTSASRALVDVAGVLTPTQVDDLVDDALCRRIASPRSVLAAADRIGGGRRGLAALRRSVAAWSDPIAPGSPAEVRLLRLLRELGVAGLVTQYEVRDAEGRFVARLDLAVPQARRGVEYDGRRFHGPRRWDHDEQRYEALRALGWVVESVSRPDLLPGEDRLRALAARLSVAR